MILKTRCPNPKCQHIHAEGSPCHVFVPSEKLQMKEESSEEESDSDDGSDQSDDIDALQNLDDDEVAALQAAEDEAAKKAAEESAFTMKDMMKLGRKGLSLMKQGTGTLMSGLKDTAQSTKMATKRIRGKSRPKLGTPDWARRAKLKRCNCDYGVPEGNPEYKPVQRERYVGGIGINFGECAPCKPWAKKLEPPVECTVGCFPYLNPRSLAHAKRVCQQWSREVDQQPHYYDMNAFEAVCQVQAHDRRIDACMGFRGFAYTSGDNCLKVWDMRQLEGTFAHKCCKDTCPITCIAEIDAFLYLGAGNGAVRQWSLPHNVKKIDFRGNMWLHNKVINDMAHWRSGEHTRLFTVSDDRTCRVWDLSVNRCIHVVEPRDRECGTLRSVCVSDDFVFLGSSNGRIHVYLTRTECRRTDRHLCHLPAGPSAFCFQSCELRHGVAEERPIVYAMEVGGFHHSEDYLFAGGSDGKISIFSVPADGLDFELVHVLDSLHTAAVTCLHCSWAHLITGSDDGSVSVLSLYSLDWNAAVERRQRIEGRVKSMFVADEDDIEEHVAYLYVGSNRGVLYSYRLGSYV